MEIRVLRYFLTVAREGSITKAAEVLHITQPTLSRQLSELEKEAGVKLFGRGPRKITLTSEGLFLMRRAEEIVELVDKTSRELQEQEKEVEGVITAGMGELASARVFSGLCGKFREKYPRVRFEFYTATADVVKERMQRGLIDVGVLLEPVDMEKFEYIRFQEKERWSVLMRSDMPLAEKKSISAQDLQGTPLILPYRLNIQGEVANWFGPLFEQLDIVCTVNMSTNAAPMIENGCYAIVVEGSADLWDKKRIISRPLEPPLWATSVFAWRRGQPFGRAAEKFIEYAKSYLSENEVQF